MSKMTIALFVGLLLAAPAAGAEETGVKWYADFDKAVEAAKAEGKDLLVDFTGSDWCSWCIRLHKEVFDHAAFNEGVKDKFVLVALDFPNGEEAKAKVPNPQRNEELKQKYQIRGFPTILLMTSDGDVYGQTGYQEGGPESYVEHLDELVKTGKTALVEVKKIVKAVEAASAEERPAALRKACDALFAMKPGSPTTKKLLPFAEEAVKADPENKTGLKVAGLKAQLKFGGGDENAIDEAAKLDPKNENGLLEYSVLRRFGLVPQGDMEGLKKVLGQVDDLVNLGDVKDAHAAEMIYANSAWCYHRFVKDAEKAKTYATKLKALGTDNPNLKMLVDTILGEAEAK